VASVCARRRQVPVSFKRGARKGIEGAGEWGGLTATIIFAKRKVRARKMGGGFEGGKARFARLTKKTGRDSYCKSLSGMAKESRREMEYCHPD